MYNVAPLLLLEAVLPKHKIIQLTLMYKISPAREALNGKAKGPSPVVTKGS